MPGLIAIGGLSGSGKSTLARGLAPFIGAPPGALVLRSDVIRKTLLGVSPLTRLGPEGYTADMNRRVYETMAGRAAAALRAGHSAIADAVFARPDDRAALARIAQEAGVPFIGVWIDGPQEILAARLRQRAADPSDANPDVLDRQARSEIGAIDWHRLDGSGDAGSIRQAAEAIIVQSAPLAFGEPGPTAS
jgi:predicted kinase